MNKKPEPPEDLWEQLEKAEKELGLGKHGQPPEGAFSIYDYMEKMGISSRNSAQQRLRILLEKDKISRVGNFVCNGRVVTFYSFKSS